MLGSFLEFATGVDQIEPAMQFYRSLGFQELTTGDFVVAPYAALWDGSVVIGLHEGEAAASLRFVRPKLKEHFPALRRLRLEIESAQFGDDQFNALIFVDNAGHRIELVEARTYSQTGRDPGAIAACGQFVEISLPTHSTTESAAFWSRLGLAIVAQGESPYPWIRMRGCDCVLGFHQTRITPGLSFAAADVRARTEFLRAHGHRAGGVSTPSCGAAEATAFAAPGGAAVYLHGRDALARDTRRRRLPAAD